jgi:hypothetical protein
VNTFQLPVADNVHNVTDLTHTCDGGPVRLLIEARESLHPGKRTR